MTTPDCPGHKDAARPAAEGPKEKAFPTAVNDGDGDGSGEGGNGFPTSVNDGEAGQAVLGDTARAGNASVDTAATAGAPAEGPKENIGQLGVPDNL